MKKLSILFVIALSLLSNVSFAADSGAILAAVRALGGKVEGFATTTVNSDDGISMVKDYAFSWLGGNDAAREELKNFRFVENSRNPGFDVSEMGTTDAYVTTRSLSSAADYLSREGNESASQLRRFFTAKVSDLKSAGVVFGYNGAAQNACATATLKILVLDPSAKKVYSLDMTPCRE